MAGPSGLDRRTDGSPPSVGGFRSPCGVAHSKRDGCSGSSFSEMPGAASRLLPGVLANGWICLLSTWIRSFGNPAGRSQIMGSSGAAYAKRFQATAGFVKGTTIGRPSICGCRVRTRSYGSTRIAFFLGRVFLRSALNRPRPDLPAGCAEQLDAEFLSFLKYVWNSDRENRPSIEAERRMHGSELPVMALRGKRQIRRIPRLCRLGHESRVCHQI